MDLDMIEELSDLDENDEFENDEIGGNNQQLIDDINFDRDCDAQITINCEWKWDMNDEYMKEYNNIIWDDIEKLCCSSLNFLKSKVDIIFAMEAYKGCQKYIYFREKKTQREFRVMNEANGCFLLELDGIPIILYEDDEITEVINKLWEFKTSIEFNEFVMTSFPNNLVRQVGVVMLFAFNNSILKQQRDQITYIG